MIAYKVFDENLCCRGFQYEVGKEFEVPGKPVLCENGFHACKKLVDCFSYYDFNPKNRVAIVDLIGDIDGDDGNKQCTNHIKIVEELKWSDVLELCNTGNYNTGNLNTGNWNTGDRNTGNYNTGNWNTGDRNTGNWNTGDVNTGDSNTGDRNTGNWNTGDWNTGNYNTGNLNTGNWNTGDRNTGNYNTGNWNTGNWNTGFFNTNEPFVRMFNKQTKLKRNQINIPSFMYFEKAVWVSHDTATDEEKEEHKKEIEAFGGFLKNIPYKEAFQKAWNKATNSDRQRVKELPNFDADIFFEISGIKV